MSDMNNVNTSVPVELNKLVCIRRTSKARRGGRDFSFSATVVVGDGNGRVGCGNGSGKDVARAVQKANEMRVVIWSILTFAIIRCSMLFKVALAQLK